MLNTKQVPEQERVNTPQNALKAKKSTSVSEVKGALANGKSATALSPNHKLRGVTASEPIGAAEPASTEKAAVTNPAPQNPEYPPYVGEFYGSQGGFRCKFVGAPSESRLCQNPNWPSYDYMKIRTRVVSYVHNGLLASEVNIMMVSMMTVLSRHRSQHRKLELDISYHESITGEDVDVFLVDTEALPPWKEEELGETIRQSPKHLIVICDLQSNFARSLPSTFCHPFPTTHWEVETLLHEMVYGPPPIAALASLFDYMIPHSSDGITPLELIDRLEDMYPELYAEALRFLEGCKNPRGVLRWKLLDMLGDSPQAQMRLDIPLDCLPLWNHLECSLLPGKNTGMRDIYEFKLARKQFGFVDESEDPVLSYISSIETRD